MQNNPNAKSHGSVELSDDDLDAVQGAGDKIATKDDARKEREMLYENGRSGANPEANRPSSGGGGR